MTVPRTRRLTRRRSGAILIGAAAVTAVVLTWGAYNVVAPEDRVAQPSLPPPTVATPAESEAPAQVDDSATIETAGADEASTSTGRTDEGSGSSLPSTPLENADSTSNNNGNGNGNGNARVP